MRRETDSNNELIMIENVTSGSGSDREQPATAAAAPGIPDAADATTTQLTQPATTSEEAAFDLWGHSIQSYYSEAVSE